MNWGIYMKLLLLLVMLSFSVMAQNQSPSYLEARGMYDYQYASLSEYRRNLTQQGYPAATVEQMVAAKAERFTNQAAMLRPRETRYQSNVRNYERYKSSMIEYYRATNAGTSLSDNQIVDQYIAQGNTAITREHYGLDRELREISTFHDGFRAETERGSNNILNALAATERTRVPTNSGRVGRYISQSVNMGTRSISVNRVKRAGEEDIVVGFEINNDGKSASEGTREFQFISPTNDPTHASLKITEDAKVSGRMSHDLMETSLYFIPRRAVPAMRYDASKNAYAVTIPTGEIVYYDAQTMRIMNIPESALHSGAQDSSANRHTRNFADIQYRGEGLSIRVDARAGNPEVPRSPTFNSNEQGAEAILTYNGQTCRVNKSELFSSDNNDSGTFYIQLTDQELNDRVLKPQCGWNIAELLNQSPRATATATDAEMSDSPEVASVPTTTTTTETITTGDVDIIQDGGEAQTEEVTVQVEETNTPDVEEDTAVADVVEAETNETPASSDSAESDQVSTLLNDPFVSSSCKTQINNFFEDPDNQELKEKYMKLQGKITLHRIAWTYLKKADAETDTIEGTIQELIAKRDPALYQEFVESRPETRNRRLGFAIKEMQTISQELAANSPEDQAYALQYSDVKMMNLLVQAEEDHGRSFANGVMDFTSIIKNSLKNSFDNKAANLEKFKSTIDSLTQEKNEFESKLVDFLKSVECSEIINATTCAREEVTESNIEKILQSSRDIVDFVYLDDFEKKEELKNIYQWNTYWLHVEK